MRGTIPAPYQVALDVSPWRRRLLSADRGVGSRPLHRVAANREIPRSPPVPWSGGRAAPRAGSLASHSSSRCIPAPGTARSRCRSDSPGAYASTHPPDRARTTDGASRRHLPRLKGMGPGVEGTKNPPCPAPQSSRCQRDDDIPFSELSDERHQQRHDAHEALHRADDGAGKGMFSRHRSNEGGGGPTGTYRLPRRPDGPPPADKSEPPLPPPPVSSAEEPSPGPGGHAHSTNRGEPEGRHSEERCAYPPSGSEPHELGHE